MSFFDQDKYIVTKNITSRPRRRMTSQEESDYSLLTPEQLELYAVPYSKKEIMPPPGTIEFPRQGFISRTRFGIILVILICAAALGITALMIWKPWSK
jgi:hypothetical protein